MAPGDDVEPVEVLAVRDDDTGRPAGEPLPAVDLDDHAHPPVPGPKPVRGPPQHHRVHRTVRGGRRRDRQHVEGDLSRAGPGVRQT